MVTTHANAEPTVHSAERGHRFVKSETVCVVADSIDCVFAFCRDTLSQNGKHVASTLLMYHITGQPINLVFYVMN